MYRLSYTGQYKKSFNLCKNRGYNMNLLAAAVALLQETGQLPPQYKPHKLSGTFKDCWECHIQPDWLLIWMQNKTELVLLLLDTGTHADLF
jgi:mRNA interferase YafQ